MSLFVYRPVKKQHTAPLKTIKCKLKIYIEIWIFLNSPYWKKDLLHVCPLYVPAVTKVQHDPYFTGFSISLRLKHWITYLISANYTQAQSLIPAVDIEQLAVVNYFFTILPGKPSQTSVKRRSASSKSIHPKPWALTSHIFFFYEIHGVIICFLHDLLVIRT